MISSNFSRSALPPPPFSYCSAVIEVWNEAAYTMPDNQPYTLHCKAQISYLLFCESFTLAYLSTLLCLSLGHHDINTIYYETLGTHTLNTCRYGKLCWFFGRWKRRRGGEEERVRRRGGKGRWRGDGRRVDRKPGGYGGGCGLFTVVLA